MAKYLILFRANLRIQGEIINCDQLTFDNCFYILVDISFGYLFKNYEDLMPCKYFCFLILSMGASFYGEIINCGQQTFDNHFYLIEAKGIYSFEIQIFIGISKV